MSTTYFDYRRYPHPCFDPSTWKSIAWPVITLLMLVALLPRITLAEQSAMLEGSQGAIAQSDWTSQVGVLAIYWQVYEGSDEFESTGFPYFSFEYQNRYFLHVSDGIGINFRNDGIVRLAASIAYAAGRDESDADNLLDLGDISDGATLNLLTEYQFGLYSIGGKISNQISGDNTGLLVDTHVAYTHIIAHTTVVKPALIASIANSRYAETYFGINEAQAASGGLDSYSPGGGLKSAGLKLDVLSVFANQWNLVGQVKYERLLSDTADSPIVLDENQFTVALGVAYQF